MFFSCRVLVAVETCKKGVCSICYLKNFWNVQRGFWNLLLREAESLETESERWHSGLVFGMQDVI